MATSAKASLAGYIESEGCSSADDGGRYEAGEESQNEVVVAVGKVPALASLKCD